MLNANNNTALATTEAPMSAHDTNAHCFWIDNDEIVDLDALTVLKDGFKANLGATLACTGPNPSYLVYVGY